MKTNSKKGFSLVELLVVVTIIAILSVVAYMALGGQTAKARNSKRMQDLSTIQSTLEIYFINNSNQYPANLTVAGMANLLPVVPNDPVTEASYTYVQGCSGKCYQLAASLEDETGGATIKGYSIGEDSLITNGVPGACTINEVPEDANCAPYAVTAP